MVGSSSAQINQEKSVIFKAPRLPIVVGDEQSKLRYLATNYWAELDAANFFKYERSSLETSFSGYCSLLNQLSIDETSVYIELFVGKVAQSESSTSYFLELADRYLYHPNSPYRNEDCYTAFLEELLKKKAITNANRTYTYIQRLELLKKNRVGYMATDFSVECNASRKYRLYDINSEFVLLLLYDPSCEICKGTISYLAANDKVSNLISSKKLTIFAVNPDGYSELWLQQQQLMPQSWIVGYDAEQQIRANQLYDLKALPSLYLLDRRKMVLIKDGNVEEVIGHLPI